MDDHGIKTLFDSALSDMPLLKDIFVSADVYGRNTYGGGGMDCDVAVRAALAAGGFLAHARLSALCSRSWSWA